ncbi:MAG: hypothetical protein KJ856_22430 [Gammaproteobacteria bacterium]|uniref:Uncharacterized protein n=1 Tax=viral metagenome TaxID=1070528 RepID=A0A6M3KM47_9ZZZZ|nr:hypothetical protein [Gammaproteobacteria bacterium]MBU1505949.1 hypothetical protein [Gammaproteobacteria bacterium]MBU2119877.1 hypothetical protein [Gammaproteobacteria bacterium]MBU2189745.1 hypothetical protein [Gammaproteobacteria bacterium]
MQKTIKESEIATIDLRSFHKALAVLPDELDGVCVWKSDLVQMPPFSSEHSPGRELEENVLLIVIREPDNTRGETIARLIATLKAQAAKPAR